MALKSGLCSSLRHPGRKSSDQLRDSGVYLATYMCYSRTEPGLWLHHVWNSSGLPSPSPQAWSNLPIRILKLAAQSQCGRWLAWVTMMQLHLTHPHSCPPSPTGPLSRFLSPQWGDRGPESTVRATASTLLLSQATCRASHGKKEAENYLLRLRNFSNVIKDECRGWMIK